MKYPVYIKNSVYGNTLTCTIYGSKEEKQKIEILTNTDSVSEAPIKKVDDPTLPKGEEKQLESGRNGYTVSTIQILFGYQPVFPVSSDSQNDCIGYAYSDTST